MQKLPPKPFQWVRKSANIDSLKRVSTKDLARDQSLRLLWLRVKPPLYILFWSFVLMAFWIEIFFWEQGYVEMRVHFVLIIYLSFWIAFLVLVEGLIRAEEKRKDY